MPCTTDVLRDIVVIMVIIEGFTMLAMYYKFSPFPLCHPLPAPSGHTAKPILLLWYWPKNKQFDFNDCKRLFNIDCCHLTDDRSVFSKADNMLIFHEAIDDSLLNIFHLRPKFQRWIWFNMEPPNSTIKIPGIQGLFNLTMNYRQDADIPVRWHLSVKKHREEPFVLPVKKRLLCWIVGSRNPMTESGPGYSYYRELVKHIKVDVFRYSFSSFLKNKDYFLTISSCKFYLAFENFTSKDYITETFNGPLAVGTVPIVLGPPRENYEDFVPSNLFIHVNDFPDAKQLATKVLNLDKDHGAYISYFDWRKDYSARRHLIGKNQEFTHAICLACAHVGRSKEYRYVPDIYKWYFG